MHTSHSSSRVLSWIFGIFAFVCREDLLASAFSSVLVTSARAIDRDEALHYTFIPCSRSLLKMVADDDEEDEGDDEDMPPHAAAATASNVLGTELCPCCTDVRGTGIGTGFYRNGFCSTGEQDLGRHTVCVQVTDQFLEFSKSVGNDLSTPFPEYHFPGLKGGDIWCLCAERWVQAYQAGKAPKLFLKATHEKTLSYVPFDILREYAIDKDDADKALDDLNEARERLNKLL